MTALLLALAAVAVVGAYLLGRARGAADTELVRSEVARQRAEAASARRPVRGGVR